MPSEQWRHAGPIGRRASFDRRLKRMCAVRRASVGRRHGRASFDRRLKRMCPVRRASVGRRHGRASFDRRLKRMCPYGEIGGRPSVTKSYLHGTCNVHPARYRANASAPPPPGAASFNAPVILPAFGIWHPRIIVGIWHPRIIVGIWHPRIIVGMPKLGVEARQRPIEHRLPVEIELCYGAAGV